MKCSIYYAVTFIITVDNMNKQFSLQWLLLSLHIAACLYLNHYELNLVVFSIIYLMYYP